MKQIPKINYFGRAIFCEILPGDNPDKIVRDAEKAMQEIINKGKIIIN